MSSECPTCGSDAAYHPQCAFAMAKLLERLVDEGYVRKERKVELLNRAWNLEHERGFLTNKELETKQAEEDLLA